MASAFNCLPMETNQHIAAFLENDIDLCSWRLICRSTHDAIDGDSGSFWHRRFLSRFEPLVFSKTGVRTADNAKYEKTYQYRREYLKIGANFEAGHSAKERKCLEILRDLAVESFINKPSDETTFYNSDNLSHILRFVEANHSLLTGLFQQISPRYRESHTTINPLLQTIRVLLAPSHLSLNDYLGNDIFNFPTSQRIVYSTTRDHPIFGGFNGLQVNMDWVLHCINFWKYHMIREWEGTLFPSFQALDDDERPRYWSSPITTASTSDGGPVATKLGTHWKGSYAFVEREILKAVRAGRGDEDNMIIMDEINGEQEAEAFQNLRLDFDSENDPTPWPSAFEEILQSTTKPISKARTRAQHRSGSSTPPVGKPVSFRFNGEGHDNTEDFFASGWLNPLPAQEGIPGWQRMTMMKYYEDDNGAIETDALWAYEGVVLPGGQIMLGRWWSPGEGTGERQYSGPFILWNVDGPKFAEEDATRAALKANA